MYLMQIKLKSLMENAWHVTDTLEIAPAIILLLLCLLRLVSILNSCTTQLVYMNF